MYFPPPPFSYYVDSFDLMTSPVKTLSPLLKFSSVTIALLLNMGKNEKADNLVILEAQ